MKFNVEFYYKRGLELFRFSLANLNVNLNNETKYATLVSLIHLLVPT